MNIVSVAKLIVCGEFAEMSFVKIFAKM